MGSWICLGGLKNDTTAPTTPVISATVASSTEIDISLTTPSTDAGGLRQYVLERSPTGSGSWTTLATGLSIFPYADTGLTSSTTYYYRCTASDFAANASVSGVVNATTQSGVAFTPLRHINFDGLTDTQSVYSTGSTAGKRWDGVANNTAYAGGYGMRATTSVARSGKTSSCALSIKSGSDGDPSGGDTGVGMGAFGGYIVLDSLGHQVSQGEEVWWGAWMFFPTGWSWARFGGGDQVKFMRWQHSGGSDHMDIYVLNGSYGYSNGETGSGGAGACTGYAFRAEYDAKANSDTDFTASAATGAIPLNQWVWVEQYTYAHSDATLAKRRLWINGVFVREQVGTAVKWRGNDGTIHTKTVTGGVKTLASSGDTLTNFAHFTYWNSYAPQDQTCYIGNIVYHKNTADLTATDEFGNKMMGTGAV